MCQQGPLLRPFCFQAQLGVKGIPLGWIQPSFHDTKMPMNNTTEMPIRNAKALAMGEALGLSGLSSSGLRTMKNRAVAKLANTPKKAKVINSVMRVIIL